MPDQWTKIAGLIAASTLAVAGGIHLGRSTIAEINPAYFSSPESTRFFTDLVPPGYDPDGVQFAEADPAWADRRDFGPRVDCQGCEPGAYAEVVGGQGVEESPWPPDDRIAEPEPKIDSSFEIDRYANFPVTRGEAERSRTSRRARIVVETAQSAEEHVEGGPVGM